ncbi:hypothetical protein [Rathayibacter sp. VKM Ac-2760]|uniref:hypothetical protein n=1 Tax=Rathayibacter sp. VKM Ac-2760 TaxID=2609253 RepID=UPI001316BCDE|nr:hypothetical protein [Rathayibacter sp. VKM Ac-2760]QHC60497.1 hypothetical protein GSU72_19495 [Rathayibacter sp. VKM Ac-2760]
MVLDEEASPSAPARPRRRRLAVALAGLAALVAVVAATGGLADVPDDTRPAYALGETFDNGLYRITVESVEITRDDPLTPNQGEDLSVVATVQLLYSGDEPAGRPEDWLRPLDLGADLLPRSLIAVRDGAVAPPVQPGLPLDVFYIWDLPEGSTAAAGDPVRLGIYERYLDAANPIDGGTTRPALVAVVEPS